MPEYRALSTNLLAQSPHFGAIIKLYAEEFDRTKGKVNTKKFCEEVIMPRVPGYKPTNFYQFLRKFRDEAGMIVLKKIENYVTAPTLPAIDAAQAVGDLRNVLMKNEEATQKGIQMALNVGTSALSELLENAHLLSPKDRAELLFKAMKSQDSRIHALGKVREDGREQAKFDRAFSGAVYE